VVSEKRERLSVTVPAGSSQGSFKIIEDSFTVPIALDRPLRTYDIEVGFEQNGGAAAPARRKQRG
jgi:hypothetical protein